MSCQLWAIEVASYKSQAAGSSFHYLKSNCYIFDCFAKIPVTSYQYLVSTFVN